MANKKERSEEEIVEIIRQLKPLGKRHVFWARVYKSISEKYNVDLEEFLKKEGDKLPYNDWGKRVLRNYKKSKIAYEKMVFYKNILAQSVKAG